MTKNKKLIALSASLAGLMLFLSGCANNASANLNTPPSHGLYGIFYQYISQPIQQLMHWIASSIGGINRYGWAIIIITFLVRLILLPMMLNQSNKMTIQQEKMRRLKPQLDLVQAQQKIATTQEEKMRLSQLMMDVYKKNDTNMMPSLGCLSLLIQLPIISGLYQAIRFSTDISSSQFLGIGLGKPSIIFTIVATSLYVIQGGISLINMPAEQKKQMQTMLLMSPAMTFFISLFAPAGLALYFLAVGIIMVLQQVITTFVIMPKVKAKIDQELKNKPIVTVVSPDMFEQVAKTPTQTQTTASHLTNTTQNNKGRNAGKQKRKPTL